MVIELDILKKLVKRFFGFLFTVLIFPLGMATVLRKGLEKGSITDDDISDRESNGLANICIVIVIFYICFLTSSNLFILIFGIIGLALNFISMLYEFYKKEQNGTNRI